MATTINSIGLILDISGGLMLFFYGLPPSIDLHGYQHRIVSQVDEDEKKRAKTHIFISRIGVILLIFGFLLQLASNYIVCNN
jgi:hypothetical protein